MLRTKYDVLVRNGKERFIVVPEREFEALQEQLEDDADFRAIEQSKKRNAGKPLTPHSEMMKKLELPPKRGTKAGRPRSA